jgi:hypothetical protein
MNKKLMEEGVTKEVEMGNGWGNGQKKTGEEQINQKGKNEEPKDNGEKTRKKGAKVGAWHMGLTLTGR